MHDLPAAPQARFAADAIEALDDATRAIAEVLDLETVLQLIVDRLRILVDADYAALGVAGPDGTFMRFITAGMSAGDRARIGSPPRGHGLLGLVIHEGESLLIPDIAAHPMSIGFPLARMPAMISRRMRVRFPKLPPYFPGRVCAPRNSCSR